MAALDPMIVTGSTGFVGRALLTQAIGAEVTPLHFGSADWRSRMSSTDFCRATVFHLAARVHRRLPGLPPSAARVGWCT
jgi:nucleoside-diphosphate-sugar epimerase